MKFVSRRRLFQSETNAARADFDGVHAGGGRWQRPDQGRPMSRGLPVPGLDNCMEHACVMPHRSACVYIMYACYYVSIGDRSSDASVSRKYMSRTVC